MTPRCRTLFRTLNPPLTIEPDWAPIMEFTAADIFQHSPFGDILNSLKSLSLSGEPWPDYGQQGWDADDEEIRNPPTTNFVATVDDLTDMLDFDSEDIDGMDADEGDDQEPAPIGHWKATSSYDIYMVDTPKDGDGEEAAEADSSKKQPKRRRQRRRSKSRHSKNGDSDLPVLDRPHRTASSSTPPPPRPDLGHASGAPDAVAAHLRCHLLVSSPGANKPRRPLKSRRHPNSSTSSA